MWSIVNAVHPRLRGEHKIKDKELKQYVGSSPPARGTYRRNFKHNEEKRFIPACAGNMALPCSPPISKTVHPRLRGEHIALISALNRSCGSSPPARGTFRLHVLCSIRRGFIPACAGNMMVTKKYRRVVTVHPRLRGEHDKITNWHYKPTCSSPPARGTSTR